LKKGGRSFWGGKGMEESQGLTYPEPKKWGKTDTGKRKDRLCSRCPQASKKSRYLTKVGK